MSCNIQFQKFLKMVGDDQQIKMSLEKMNSEYNLKQYKILGLSSAEVQGMFNQIQNKFYRKHTQKCQMKWLENQLRIFIWCVCCFVQRKKCTISSLDSQDWQIFSNFFNSKSPKLFDYQTKLVFRPPLNGSIWTAKEEQFLKIIIKKHQPSFKWSQISKDLYLDSDKQFLRTPKQCRQRWNNHIDPEKIKGSWKIEECLQMFEYVRQNGKKWAKLVKLFDHQRDQHSIKNKFNSLVRKQQKLSNYQFSQKQIYDCIITRLKKAILKNGSTSIFETEDYEKHFSKDCTEQKTAKYSEILRQKLMKCTFRSQKTSQTLQSKIEQFNEFPTQEKIKEPTIEYLEQNIGTFDDEENISLSLSINPQCYKQDSVILSKPEDFDIFF